MNGNGQSLAIVERFATAVGVDPQTFVRTIKSTVLKSKDRQATDEEMIAFLAIAQKYGLSPWTKEIHAFIDSKSGAIVPIVGIDGWNRIANEHAAYQGEQLLVPPREEWVQIDSDAKLAPPYMTVLVYRSDRLYPTEHTEYLDECYVPVRRGNGRNGAYEIRGHWQTHTKRALEHKTRMQGRRVAFGFSGIYDEDEAERIISGQKYDVEGTAVEATDDGQVIDEPQLTALLDEMRRTGLSEEAVRKNLELKAGYSGPLQNMPVRVYEPLMAGLAKMPTKEPQEPDGAGEPEAEPQGPDADEPQMEASPEASAGDPYWPQDDDAEVPGMDARAAKAQRAAQGEHGGISPQQMRALMANWKQLEDRGYTEAQLREQMAMMAGGKTSRKALTIDEASTVIKSFANEVNELKKRGEAA